MASISGNRTLSGTWAQLWVDGEPIAELKNIKVNIKIVRTDVQMGISVDSKVTGLKGEGSFTLFKTYTRFFATFTNLKKGLDVRMSLIAKLEDPDATLGQVERYSIDNVALSEFPAIDWQTGEGVEMEIPFVFTPTEMYKLDGIYKA